jgi:soluble epoxide hydrolase/lipid-phosphate phosphatase
VNGKTLSYLEAGPSDGTLMIFCHGWPSIAETWMPQITTFAGLGFRVMALDMPAYGGSYKTKNKSDFSLKSVNASLLGFLKAIGRREAIWLGHDWGSTVVWSFLAHHPEACTAVVAMCLPYRTLELGIAQLVQLADRDVYPKHEFPNAQWDYMSYYQDDANFEKQVKEFESDVPNFIRLMFRKGNPELEGKPAFLSFTTNKEDGLEKVERSQKSLPVHPSMARRCSRNSPRHLRKEASMLLVPTMSMMMPMPSIRKTIPSTKVSSPYRPCSSMVITTGSVKPTSRK